MNSHRFRPTAQSSSYTFNSYKSIKVFHSCKSCEIFKLVFMFRICLSEWDLKIWKYAALTDFVLAFDLILSLEVFHAESREVLQSDMFKKKSDTLFMDKPNLTSFFSLSNQHTTLFI